MNEKKKPSIIKSAIKTITISILSIIVAYYFIPSFVEISAEINGYDFCSVHIDSKMYNLFCSDSMPRLSVYLDNNNDGLIRVENINVRTKSFVRLDKSDVSIISDVGGMGDTEKPIYLISKVSSKINGVEKCDYNYELGEYSSNDYIELASNSGDKFFINLEPLQSGIYEVQIEFDYVYHGKERTIITEPCTFVYMNQSISDFYN